MLNNKKERYDTVNSTSRRPPGALSSSAAENEANAGGAEEMYSLHYYLSRTLPHSFFNFFLLGINKMPYEKA